MFRKLLVLLIGLAISLTAFAGETEKEKKMENVNILMKTSMGDIELELWPEKAPETVANFVKYVTDEYYNGVVFHRIINGFMIQAGGFSEDSSRKTPKYDQIKNEADNMLSNEIGTIAMARTGAPHSAQAQFFINVNNNASLDHRDKNRGYGYCVFGKVTKGLDIVNLIKVTPTQVNPKNGMQDWPIDNVIINKVEIVK